MRKLTKPMIDAAKATEREVVLWDATLPGFGVRIKPSGVKSFCIQYRTEAGRSRRVTLGRLGVLTLDEARKEARALLSETARGRDVRQELEEKRSSITVSELADRYMTDHCEGRCKPSTIAAHEWLLKKYIRPALGRRRLLDLRHAEIDRFHQNLKSTPYNANRSLGLLKAMFGRAEVWGLMPQGGNPARHVRKFRERKRQRFLSLDELRRLIAALDAAERDGTASPFAVAAFRMLILTGARHDEIRLLRWEQVDWRRQHLLLTEHKSDAAGAKTIPLNAAALAQLQAIPRIEGNDHVFCGMSPGKPIINLQKPWRRIRAAAALEDVRIHDLRHSFASFAIAAGASLPVVGGLLGHRSVAATATYAHLAADPVRAAAELVGKSMSTAFEPATSVAVAADSGDARRR